MTASLPEDQLPPLTAAMAQKLARSPSPAARRWWERLQATLLREPEPYRTKLARDLQSKKVDEFYAAAFELYLTQLFIDKGWRFRREEPLPGRLKRPDYLIEHPDAPFYLEATVAMDSKAQLTQDDLLNDLRETLRLVRGPLYAIATVLTPIPGSYSRKHVRQWLAATVAELTAPGAPRQAQRTYRAPAGSANLCIRFDFMPDSDDDQVVGGWFLHGGKAVEVTTGTTILGKIDSKLKQYARAPELPSPYVVALHINTGFGATGFQVTRALYGTLSVHLTPGEGPDRAVAYSSRASNGLLTATDAAATPIRRRISAVLLYQQTFPDQETELNELVVCHHPAAAHPLPRSVFADWPQLQLVRGRADVLTPRWTMEPPEWALSHWG